MSSWALGPLLSLDFESCGLPAHDTSAVQIGLARIGYPDEAAACHTYLVNPDRPISPEAEAVHGISQARCQAEGVDYKMTLAEVADTITNHLSHGWPLIAFNAAFDCTLLEAELSRLGLMTVTESLGRFAPVIDPLVIDKAISRRKGSRKLVDQCEFYGVRNDGAHDAGEDALAAARLAWMIAKHNPDIAEADPYDLHQQQIHWRQEQQDSLRAYFDRQGIHHDGVDGRWPLALPERMAAAS